MVTSATMIFNIKKPEVIPSPTSGFQDDFYSLNLYPQPDQLPEADDVKIKKKNPSRQQKIEFRIYDFCIIIIYTNPINYVNISCKNKLRKIEIDLQT